MKNTPTFRTLAWVSALCFLLFGTANAYTMSRIVPSGKVKVYGDDGRLVQVLKEETVLVTGATLVPEGDCGVRMNNFFMVGKDASVFSVQEDRAARVKIEKGLLYFAVNRRTGPVVIDTPSGVIGTEQIVLLSSSTSTMLKGYVDVSGRQTRMGVIEGGSLVVSTPEGMRTIETGRQITIAQAELIKPGPVVQPEAPATPGAAAQPEKGLKPDAPASPEEKPLNPRTLAEPEKPAAPPKALQPETADEQKPAKAKPVAQEDDDDGIPAVYLIGGGALAGLGLAAAFLGGGGGDDAPPPASPSSP